MASPFRIRPRLRAAGMGLLRAGQRRALKAHVDVHTDGRGRRTPVLQVGAPRRGTLVWLHGFSDRFDSVLQLAPHLRRDWRIVSPSMPAFGEGWVDPTEVHTIGAYADWMSGVLRDLVSDGTLPSRFHLMGNSLGGATALGVAAQIPQHVETVVALNAAGVQLDDVRCAQAEIADGDNLFRIQTRREYERLQDRIFERRPRVPGWITTHLYEEMRRQAGWYTRLGDQLAQSEVRAEGPGWRSFIALADVTPAALVLWGDGDGLFPVALGEKMAEQLPDARFEALAGVGHAAHVERPKALAAAFERWAKQAPNRI